MSLSERDTDLLRLVGQFGQLSSRHISSLVFSANASSTPAERALKRLTDQKYLSRIERRLVGGEKGGSGQYCYQLGPEGWKMAGRVGRYRAKQVVSHHSLAIADCFVALVEAENAGTLRVLKCSTEPDTWANVGGSALAPDLYVEVGAGSARLQAWVEVDMGTQHRAAIKDKLERYWHAYEHVDTAEWPTFPIVLFVTPTPKRTAEIKRQVASGPTEGQALFRVGERDKFGELVMHSLTE